MDEMSLQRSPSHVRAMFSRICRRYDMANHVLSGGMDFLWRRRAAALVQGWQPECVLDLATGSGDLALAIRRKCPGTMLVGADFSEPMLTMAQHKRVMNLVTADGMALPFRDASFDVVTVAFGLRNMESWADGLREMARVLRPNGHVLILDFALPSGVFRPLYSFYLHHLLPRLARVLTGEKTAYNYLGKSIEAFPSRGAMCDLICEAGFVAPKAQQLALGAVALYTATVKAAA